MIQGKSTSPITKSSMLSFKHFTIGVITFYPMNSWFIQIMKYISIWVANKSSTLDIQNG
jgi:hypothetical protein